jgi:hypothetical protein
MKPAIFRDTEIQQKFDKDGYVLFDFITEDQAKAIGEKFYQLHDTIPAGFYADAFSPDDEIKREIFEHTEAIIQPTFDKFFKDYKKLGSTFLCKGVGPEGNVKVHQDWMTVDENKYYTGTIWIPIQDTNEENGALRVIPGSHQFFDSYRSNNIPVSYKGSEQLLWDNMLTINMKAGQALVINHAIIHGSSPNLSAKERLVIAYGITCKDAKLLFYHMEPKSKDNFVEKFDMPDDFFLKYYNVGDRPLIGNMVDRFPYKVRTYSNNEIQTMINTELKNRGLLKKSIKKRSIFDKIKLLFQ